MQLWQCDFAPETRVCIHYALLSISTPMVLAAPKFASPGTSYTAGQSAHLPGVATGLSSSLHHLSHPLPTHPATSSCGQTVPQTQTRVQGSSPVTHPTLCQALAALQVMSSRCESSFGLLLLPLFRQVSGPAPTVA